MRRALSVFKGSKKNSSKSDEKPTEKVDEELPPYTASSSTTENKPQEGKVQLKRPKGVGCAIVSARASKDTKNTATDSSQSKAGSCRFPVFAFGKADLYVCIPTYSNNTPDGYAVAIRQSSFIWQKKEEIDKIYWYSLTPYDDEIIAYKDEQSGLVMWAFHRNAERPEHAPMYTELMRWLKNNVEHEEKALQQSSVVFGPNGSYFARSATMCIWHDIPDALQNKIDAVFPGIDPDKKPIPDIVAFGAAGSVVIWHPSAGKERIMVHTLPEDHVLLKNGINKLIAKEERLDHMALSLSNKDNGFMCSEAGQVVLMLSPCGNDRSIFVLTKIVQWMQHKAKNDEETLVVSVIAGESNETVKITPESNWTGVEYRK